MLGTKTLLGVAESLCPYCREVRQVTPRSKRNRQR